jgi:GH25 family lysozyme M1 (1,4-beta-N-acetylmuramidase)
LGIVALAITAASIVLISLGKGLPAIARSVVVILVLVGVGGLTWKVISVSQVLPNQPGDIEPSETETLESYPPGADPITTLQMLNQGTKRYMLGVDVSHHDKVDWRRVGDTPISFVFVRATQGTKLRDATFAANWKGAGEAHIARGAYHFFIADEDGAEQANNFLAVLRSAGADTSELPAALDLEEVPRTTRISIDNFTFVKRVHAWLDRVEAGTKKKPIIYTTMSFWDSHGSADLADYLLWVPRYSASPPTASQLPRGWNRWAIWQCTNEAPFVGFGTVEANILDSQVLPFSPR